jgi:hypothetical protein
MKPEVSLPHSQAPATCPYPVTQQSSPCLSINFNIILQSFTLCISIKISYWLYKYGITDETYGNNIQREFALECEASVE